MSEVRAEGHIVWNTQQIKDILDASDDDNGVIEINIRHGFDPGKKVYHVTVWRYPRLTLDAEGLETSSNIKWTRSADNTDVPNPNQKENTQ